MHTQKHGPHRVHTAWRVTSALCLALTLACGSTVQMARPNTVVAEAQAPAAPAVASPPTSFEARLHPRARTLLHEAGRDAAGAGVNHGLPLAACTAAVRFSAPLALDCALITLGSGAAVLVLRSTGCSQDRCFERSWVFLKAYRDALPLPARRKDDYRALRAELTSEAATSLWLSGFRGTSDTRVVAVEGPEPELAVAVPPLSDYTSCEVSPDGRELWCRSLNGDLVGIDAARGVERLVATLGLPADAVIAEPQLPAYFTGDGQLALELPAMAHPLCGEQPCTLVGLVAWPSAVTTRARLVRADTLPY